MLEPLVSHKSGLAQKRGQPSVQEQGGEVFAQLIGRGELQGVSAASYGLFDKAPIGLTRPESAVMAALIRAPNAEVNPFGIQRFQHTEGLGQF